MPQPRDAQQRTPHPSEICPHCKRWLRSMEPRDYACPKCGRFLDNLYRSEHLSRAAARCLSFDGIRAEYRALGWEMPGWLP